MDNALAPINTVDEPRECSLCHRFLPAGAFAWGNGERRTQCRECERTRIQRQQVALAQETTRQAVADFFLAARKERLDCPHIVELCAEMFALWGGPKGFAQKMHEQIEAAIERCAGSTTVLQALQAQVKLVQAATELRDTAPDVSKLTDEQLADEILALTKQVLGARCPALEEGAEPQ